MWKAVDENHHLIIYKDENKKVVQMKALEYERRTGNKTKIKKDEPPKNKCLFSQGGYCVCWEGPGMDKKCNGVKAPKGCPANK